jgi:NO-binding membrane sensor protein with MHYT domain
VVVGRTRPGSTDTVRRSTVAATVFGFAVFMLHMAGPIAIVLTPVAYLYFVLFSPRDRPEGHVVLRIAILLGLGSAAVYYLFSVLY